MDAAGRKCKRGCLLCGQQKTPQWREGPLGPQTLCNACGVGWRKEMRAAAPTAATGNGDSEAGPSPSAASHGAAPAAASDSTTVPAGSAVGGLRRGRSEISTNSGGSSTVSWTAEEARISPASLLRCFTDQRLAGTVTPVGSFPLLYSSSSQRAPAPREASNVARR